MAGPEIVITVGFPAAGKSSLVEKFEKTHKRLNRDRLGGTLAKVDKKLKELLEKGDTRFVLDNTYPTVESRAAVIRLGKAHGIPVRCLWVRTSIEDAQLNAALRIVKTYGRLLTPAEIKHESKSNPNCFPATVLFSYRKIFEQPTHDEGFDEIKRVKFERVWSEDYKNKALILDYDGTLRDTISGDKYPTTPDDIEILPGRAEVLQRYKDKGYLLLGVSNQSGVDKEKLTDADAHACFKRTNELVGHDIEYHFCPHGSFPIACFCRKPMPGLAALLIEKHKLDPSQCIMVGDMTSDKTFASRAGFQYQHASKFF